MLKGILITDSIHLNAAISDLLPIDVEFNSLTVKALQKNKSIIQFLMPEIAYIVIDFTYNNFYKEFCELYKDLFQAAKVKVAIVDFNVPKHSLITNCKFTHVLNLDELNVMNELIKNTKNT